MPSMRNESFQMLEMGSSFRDPGLSDGPRVLVGRGVVQ